MIGSVYQSAAINYGQPVNWAHPLNRGLVSWWLPLSTSGLRLSDHAGFRHGLFTGGGAWNGAIRRPGSFGSASLNGSNYVDFGTALAATLSGSFTVSFWLFLRGSGNGNIFGNRGASHSRLLSFNTFSPNALSTVQEGLAIVQSVAYSAFLSTWKHIVWTYDAPSTTSALYFDGILQSSVSYTFTAAWTGTDYLGDDGATKVDADMDDLRLYNRALSSSEVFALYSNSRTGYPGTLNRLRRPWLNSVAAVGGNRRRRVLMGAA